MDSLIRVQALIGELRRLGRIRELRDYIWWSAQDTGDYADGQLAEALRQLAAGELAEEYALRRRSAARPPRTRPGSGGGGHLSVATIPTRLAQLRSPRSAGNPELP